MRDEMFDREYQQGRDALNDGIDRAVAKISEFFSTTGRAIHKFEFDAPWQDGPARPSSRLVQRSAPAKRATPIKRARAA